MVLRWEVADTGARVATAGRITLNTDGTFEPLWFEFESFIDRKPRHIVESSPGDYAYTKVNDDHATIDLTFDSGGSELFELTFTSSSNGELSNRPSPSWFTLTEATDVRNAAVLNVSTRGQVSPGHPMIVGFVVPNQIGNPDIAVRRVLIRAVGPSLAELGVSDVWEDPDFQIVRLGAQPSNPPRPSLYGNWSVISYAGLDGPVVEDSPTSTATFGQLFELAGAFPLIEGSNDAVDLRELQSGPWTVVASVGENDPGGEVLIEVYFLP